MRSELLAIGLFVLVAATATMTVRHALCRDGERNALVRLLAEHAPLIEKDKQRVVLLYPASAFSEIIVGMNLPQHRLLPVPDRFVPVDHRAIASFGAVWLVTPRGKAPRPFEGALLSIEKTAASDRFILYRLTPPRQVAFTAIAGGAGGNPFSLLCPLKTFPDFISFVSPKEGLTALRVLCRDSQGTEKEQRTFGDPRKGTQTPLSCPEGRGATGMTLYADNIVRGIALHCSAENAPTVGRTNLPATRLACPAGAAIKGFFGSSGALIDSLGLACGK